MKILQFAKQKHFWVVGSTVNAMHYLVDKFEPLRRVTDVKSETCAYRSSTNNYFTTEVQKFSRNPRFPRRLFKIGHFAKVITQHFE